MRIFRLLMVSLVILLPRICRAEEGAGSPEEKGFVAIMQADMLILPGTEEYLRASIERAAADGAKLLIVKLDTPGGMLNTTQRMIQDIFNSPIPIIIYVFPTGATATSAGVFVTLAGHVAAMAPGTSIGAAHPVAGDGKDIEGDMRQKAENMTVAMVKSISEQRGRNLSWAEKAVKESSSATEKEALKLGVIDIIAEDIDSLLRQSAGKKIKLGNSDFTIGDYSNLPKREYEISFKQKTINTLANPSVLALLWLAATTGLTIELYNPGAILPGVVGLISLILALAMSQIIPITQGGLLLIIVGALMIASEVFVTSGVLGIGGVAAMVIGSIYLVDVIEAPGLSVNLGLIVPTAIVLGGFMLFLAQAVVRSSKRKEATGEEAMIGMIAEATENFSNQGKVFVNGEVWTAELIKGFAEKGDKLVVRGVQGLVLQVEKAEKKDSSV